MSALFPRLYAVTNELTHGRPVAAEQGSYKGNDGRLLRCSLPHPVGLHLYYVLGEKWVDCSMTAVQGRLHQPGALIV